MDKIKVYKSYQGKDIQFSFVREQGKLYYFVSLDGRYLDVSEGSWGATPASRCADPSSWQEVLVCTGRSRAELEQRIKDWQDRTRDTSEAYLW